MPDLTAYVRAIDLDGESWTIPGPSSLHRSLAVDVALGNGTPVLPVEAMREERLPEPPDMAQVLIDYTAETSVIQALSARKIWRLGQYARLVERIQARG